MEFVNTTGLEAAWLVRQVKPPATALIVIAKGTFQLRPGDAATLADPQLPLTGDEFESGDDTKPLRYAFDFAPFKPRADVLVVGTCYAPDGRPTDSVTVSMRVGALAKSLRVHGQRSWLDENRHTPPEPFVSLPLSWEAAYGGQGFDRNPFGLGFTVVQRADGRLIRPLPEIESPTRPLRSALEQVEPAGFGPIPDLWPQRLEKFGSFDPEYVKQRWPGYPLGFQWSFFNTAPADQQIDGYLHGDEPFALENLHPQVPVYRGRLPGVRVRAIVNEQAQVQERLRDVPMCLDTLWLDMDTEQMVLVWRGHISVSSETLEEIAHLLIVTEPVSQEPARPVEEYAPLLDEALTRLAREDGALEEEEEEEDDEEDEEEEEEAPELDDEAVEDTAPHGQSEEDDEEEEEEDDEDALTEARATALIAARASLAGRDLSGLALHHLDLSGLDLRDAILAQTTLAESNLTGADFSGAVLTGANLHGAVCVGTTFAEADLTNVWLVHADLSDADLTGADLSAARLRGAVLRGAKAVEAVFAEADLSDADLEGADLTASDLCRTRLHRTRLAGATLTDAALEGAWGHGVDLSKAVVHKLRGAGALLYEVDLHETVGEESVWEGADLSKANFSGATLPRAEFSGACLRQAVFDAATLNEARFNEADLRRARLVRSNLYEASLEKANLADANFTESNLFGATLMDAATPRTNFTGANLRRIKAREDIT